MSIYETAVPKVSAAKGRTQNDGKVMTLHEGTVKEYATSQKVAGSIPAVFIGILH